tara:strand:- start:105 stop:506 length:402 start_codon:yes stop_codon:yes gene_type:complete
MKHVYKLVNELGRVEWVGETVRPKVRFYEHTKVTPSSGKGMFYGRTDLTMEVVASNLNKEDARILEDKLKIKYGLPLSERSPKLASRKLTFDIANEIRSKYIPRKYSSYKLAKEYGVSQRAIMQILEGLAYNE